jgi:hypothetical protein
MVLGDFRSLGVVADEPDDWRVVLHPGVARRRSCDLIDQALLDAFVIFPRHRADAAFQQAAVGKGTGVVAGREGPDHAWQGIQGVRIKGMRNRCYSLFFKRLHSLHDLVAEIDSADALVPLLNTGGFAGDRDFEPDPADTRRLNRQVAGFTGDACVGPVAPDHRIEGSVSAHLLVDHDVDEHVPFELYPGGFDQLDGHDVAGNAAFHICGSATVYPAVSNRCRPGIIAPAFTDRDHVGMTVQQQ